jgi:type 1 glutamine amidotransferase
VGNILVICDDPWHPARTPRAGLAPLAGHGVSFDWIEYAGEWSAERMAAYPLTILTKSNHTSADDRAPWMTPEVEAAFRAYVGGGGGLLAIHSGTAGYLECPTLRGLLGGVFARHPAQCPVTVEPRVGHPLCSASAPFTLVDEHYMIELDDPQADVFLTTRSEHGAQPAGWTRREGTGRVCVLTPGHNLEIWLRPEYQALIANAIGWCQPGA